MNNAISVSLNFKIDGNVISATSYGNGHINDTYLITTENASVKTDYILQRINKNVFKNPPQLMDNMASVTRYLAKMIADDGGDPMRETLNVIETVDGKNYYLSPEGDYYRMLVYVTDNKCFDKVERP